MILRRTFFMDAESKADEVRRRAWEISEEFFGGVEDLDIDVRQRMTMGGEVSHLEIDLTVVGP